MSPPPDNALPGPQQASVLRLQARLAQASWGLTLGYLAVGAVWLLACGLASGGESHLDPGWLAFLIVSAVALFVLLQRGSRWLVGDYRAQAETTEALQERFHALPCPVLVYDLQDLRILDANPAALTFFGTSRDVFLTRTLHAIWPEPDPVRLEAIIDSVRAKGRDDCVVTEPLLAGDGIRHVEIRSQPLTLGARPARLVVLIDRSAEQQALHHRAEALERLHEAQAIARLGSWEIDPGSRIGEYSDEVYRIMARALPSQRRHGLEELLAASDMATQARIDHLFEDIYAGKAMQVDVLLPLIAGNGQERMIHLCAESTTRADGSAVVRGTMQDVTERERSRRLLREREEQFRELVRVLPDGVMILSGERVMYANAACATQFGYEGEALLGEPLHALVAESDYASVVQLLEAGSLAEPGHTVRRMRRRDTSLFRADLSVGRVRYGGRDCRLLVVRDLSEPERMRDALAEGNAELQAMARRLFSLQEDERRAISRDLHDDIGQAITAMKISAYAAQDEPDPVRRREDLQDVVALADATVVKLRNLSMLLRPPQLDALGLEAAIRWQASALFRASQVRLELDMQPLPRRPSNEIEQACFRIAQESLTNALRHACAGEVVLALRCDDQAITLEVSDDGDGFDPDGPRGLGLIVMRERAQTAGGTLRIDSAPGAGTRVILHLPYSSAPGDAGDGHQDGPR